MISAAVVVVNFVVMLSLSVLLRSTTGFVRPYASTQRTLGGVLGRLASSPSSRFANNKMNSVASGRLMCTSAAVPAEQQHQFPDKKMPVTIISGFLGAGKTTFLQNLLTNTKGTKYGLVVNDMASVNIDSKLIKKQTASSSPSQLGDFDGVDTLELQNGCVCCNLADDLLLSVAKLTSLAYIRGVQYDHIVVECSGISEPRGIRQIFQDMEDAAADNPEGHIARGNMVALDTFITLVDATVFMDFFGSDKTLADRRTLFEHPKPEDAEKPVKAPEEADSNNMVLSDVADAMTSQRRITDLLLEQVECADHILLNKCDLLSDPDTQIPLLKTLLKSINPNATIHSCTHGQILDPLSIVGNMGGTGVANVGILEEHKNSVIGAEQAHHHHHHHHEHEHEHGHHDHDCNLQSAGHCDHPSHKSHNNHQHHDSNQHDCQMHSHGHCDHPSHSHSHDHSHSHSHSHNHEHSHATTAQTRFGITSFVYRRRRPFHPQRLNKFLTQLGKTSVSELHALSQGSGSQNDDINTKEDFVTSGIIRSKGFMWLALSSRAAYYLSQAGKFLRIVL
jgi:G3E family GTPase